MRLNKKEIIRNKELIKYSILTSDKDNIKLLVFLNDNTVEIGFVISEKEEANILIDKFVLYSLQRLYADNPKALKYIESL